MITTQNRRVSKRVVLVFVVLLVVAPLGVNYMMNNRIASLSTTYENYLPTHSHTDSEYGSLNSSYQNYMSTHSHNNSEYDNYVADHQYTNFQYSSLENQISILTDIVDLNTQMVFMDHLNITQPPNSYNLWYFGNINYAGYFTIIIHSSTTTNGYATLIYTYGGTTWTLSKILGVSGLANFPILPDSDIEVRIGNTNLVDSATHEISIVYIY